MHSRYIKAESLYGLGQEYEPRLVLKLEVELELVVDLRPGLDTTFFHENLIRGKAPLKTLNPTRQLLWIKLITNDDA